ncbi:classical arabinogalactan protein 9 isoform X1 [Brachypodium distachyon]|uniref:classical arabinogalactan protein 9 isoform X1 n=1 Tax=Brachypodium distachyon TaxID=15368 RepID=UPI00052FEDDA|nr:classical arabinogalactan protein 9 isoform X1 [Brachypodium distachyon]|eukprot:XP_003576320.2 classical arabinogalactan protein 9 isoform X1 [Brachypodium distachyon]
MATKLCLALLLVVMAVAATPAAATRRRPESRVLWYPGIRPRGGSSPSVFPGWPRRPSSPPASSRFSPPSPRPSPPASPSPVVPTPPSSTPPPCVAAARPLPGFPGVSSSPSTSSSSAPADCVTPLAGLMTCGPFLTGSAQDTPAPGSECCSGLGMFLNSTAAAEDRSLRCLCPVILGDVNRMLPRPVDPVRMMYLPISCGVVLPPQVLFICFTGQPTPPVVSRIPDSWRKTFFSSSSLSSSSSSAAAAALSP